MTTLTATITTMELPEPEARFDEAQLAAVAFLARYSGRTLDAYPARPAHVFPVERR